MNTSELSHTRTITIPAPSDVVKGQMLVVNNLVGIVDATTATGKDVVLHIDIAIPVPKATGYAITVGSPVYWDSADEETNSDSTNPRIGTAYKASASGDTTAYVLLNRFNSAVPANVTAAITAAIAAATGDFITMVDVEAIEDTLTPVMLAPNTDMLAVPFVLTVPLGAATPVNIFNADAPFAFRVIDFHVVCTGTNGSGSATLQNGTNAITNAVACETDGNLARAATIDDARHEIAANGSLRIVKNGAGDTGVAYVTCVKI